MNVQTKFAIKIKCSSQVGNGWIAIGVALQKIIKSKSYGFGLNVGHGAYLISSNKGSWSHTDSSNNNIVKSFDFADGNIVELLFDPLEGFIHFQLKDNPQKHYKLQIDNNIQGDTYHPCVLFYYAGDEAELIYPVTN